MPGEPGRGAAVILVSALTHLHPGAGRSLGAVDLPVVRDSLHIPFLSGSMFKGALKTQAAWREAVRALQGLGLSEDEQRRVLSEIFKGGSIKCDVEKLRLNRLNVGEEMRERIKRELRQLKDLCCLLGGEPGEGHRGASAVSISDFYPLAVPAAAHPLSGGLDGWPGGIVYVATVSALSLIKGYIDIVEGGGGLSGLVGEALSRAMQRFEDSEDVHGVAFGLQGGDAVISVTGVAVRLAAGGSLSLDQGLLGELQGMHPLYESHPIQDRLVVLRDDVGRSVLNAAMEKRARVALSRETKTVRTGPWYEEYFPWGTLLVGLAAETGFRNEYCSGASVDRPIQKLREYLEQTLRGSIVLGGKESVGAGLARVKVLMGGQQ